MFFVLLFVLHKCSALVCVLQICFCSSFLGLNCLGPLYFRIKFVSLFKFQEKRNSTGILIEILLIAIKLISLLGFLLSGDGMPLHLFRFNFFYVVSFLMCKA